MCWLLFAVFGWMTVMCWLVFVFLLVVVCFVCGVLKFGGRLSIVRGLFYVD